MIHLLCVMDTKQLISVVSVLFLLAATVSTRTLLHTERYYILNAVIIFIINVNLNLQKGK
jgi:hypothetical protein